jgi:hypothetical protein
MVISKLLRSTLKSQVSNNLVTLIYVDPFVVYSWFLEKVCEFLVSWIFFHAFLITTADLFFYPLFSFLELSYSTVSCGSFCWIILVLEKVFEFLVFLDFLFVHSWFLFLNQSCFDFNCCEFITLFSWFLLTFECWTERIKFEYPIWLSHDKWRKS